MHDCCTEGGSLRESEGVRSTHRTSLEDLMRWLRGIVSLCLLAVAGCGGSSGEDSLTLSFQGFSGDGIEQADFVSGASASVDVCQGLCQSSGSGGQIEIEDYTETFAFAIFVNRGKADIELENYTIEVLDSGLPILNRTVSSNIPGGRCTTSPQTQCATNTDCLGGNCQRQETAVPILLYDFEFKQIAVDGQCPLNLDTFELTGGTVIPRNYDVIITFTGVDQTDKRRVISTGYATTFADIDSCDQ